MLGAELYILGAGHIAPIATYNDAVMRLTAKEPSYAGLIPPMQLRRMSKAVRMGVGASSECLEMAGLNADAIAVGTALGCVADTEVFLRKMIEQEEQMLTPTAFIQSTHNTVAGQIALGISCHGYNTTIVQRGHSFEGAIVSAWLYLCEHPDHTILVGGVDELTDTSFALLQRTEVYTRTPFPPADILKTAHQGAIAGEGAAFLMLSRKPAQAKTKISLLQLFTEKNYATACERLEAYLVDKRPTDIIVAGAAGDLRGHSIYCNLNYELQLFKQETGEWGTAVAVAIAKLIKHWPMGADRVWILNNYGQDFSVWLVERV